MSLAKQLFQSQDPESEQAIEEYYKNHKEQLFKYPNMVPTYDRKTKKVYCVYKPKSVDDLLDMMIGLSAKDVDRLLKRYGFFEHQLYVYKQLQLTRRDRKKRKSKKRCDAKPTKSTISVTESHSRKTYQMANFFSFAFDTDANVFVHFLNKETKGNYFYPLDTLKDEIKLSAILYSHTFSRNVDLMYSLSTYKTMKGATEENIFSIPLIQVDVDYRKISKYKNKLPWQIWQYILKSEVGNTIPYPSAIEYGHQLRLLFKIKDLYIKTGSESSKNVARRISKVFSKRLNKYGAEAQPITSHGRIAGSINSKDGSIIQIKQFGYEYVIEEIKEKWLDPLPDWYLEWKSKAKKKDKVVPHFNTLTLNKKRLRDLFRMVKYFNGDLDGRKFLCFIVRSHALSAGYTPLEAKNLMLELNDHFKTPLKSHLIEQNTRNVERKQYFHRNETILDWLCITPEMEEKMMLETIISDTEKKRRNRVKKARQYREKTYGDPNISKRALIEVEKQKIKHLLEEGLRKKDISKILEIHPKTLQRRIKELKSEGSLQ